MDLIKSVFYLRRTMGISTYTFENVRPLSSTAKQILNKRYMQEGEKTWDELVDRVVYTIVPKDSDDFLPTKEMISHRYFLPNSPCLANAGKEGAGLCACFVVDFKDTTDDIIKTKADFIYIARKGGGAGTTLSNLRPKGSPVRHSSHGYAGGPVGFADTISHDMKVFTQGGLRGMAIMFTISVYHPDVIDFILAKEREEDKQIENANMSVVVDSRFMELVKADGTYWTEFDGVKYKEYKARDIFNLIVEGAWRNGEPGVLFQDRINDSPYKFTDQKIQATNPCSEQPLPPNGVCNLGSLDLSKFFKKDKSFDFDKLEYATRLGTRFLDRVVDKSVYPTPQIDKWAHENRAIGMGIMGFADYCLMRQIAYGSEESLKELDYILFNIYAWTKDESEKLGKELGIPKECKKLPEPRRNITLVTVAPTGTVSLIAGCSSGIEPIFSEITIRNDKTGTYVFEDKLADKPYFRCAVSSNGATEVTWEEHVKVLAMAQKNIDSGVSKTINFPTMTHRDTISKAIFMAWELGCKGIAVYRNGSRKVEVLTPKNVKKDLCPNCDTPLVMIANVKTCPACSWKVKVDA
jgi:ribonucleoside-diphosphate reductase alpha chain